jgi:hypothetical protein
LEFGKEPSEVQGNRFTTVPKDAVKHRGIAVEPSLNVYYQLVVGQYLKRRLLKKGVDLFNGQERHALLARQASRHGHLATLDLSSASDTVSKTLVKLLLPEEWYRYLASLRSPKTLLGSNWVYLEKFSSMGNGFTFELETLIFHCLIEAVLRREGVSLFDRELYHSTYGDDIIIPREGYDAAVSVLEYCGFSVNRRKSFSSTHFRESCGGNFFHGHDVSTVKVEEAPTSPEHWIVLVNNLKRVDTDLLYLRRAHQRCLRQLPRHIRLCKGPVSLGDLVIHDDDRNNWQTRWDRHTSRGFIRVWRPIHRSIPLKKWSSRVQLAALLLGIPSSGPIPRYRVSGYKHSWVALS